MRVRRNRPRWSAGSCQEPDVRRQARPSRTVQYLSWPIRRMRRPPENCVDSFRYPQRKLRLNSVRAFRSPGNRLRWFGGCGAWDTQRGHLLVRKRAYRVTRDLHPYSGLFISSFVLIFAASVFFLVHTWVPGISPGSSFLPRTVHNLHLAPDLDNLFGRARVDAVRGLLDQAGVHGETGFIRRIPKEHWLVVPVSVPGRETTVDIDLTRQSAIIRERQTGLADADAP